jgi:hypothetical protein
VWYIIAILIEKLSLHRWMEWGIPILSWHKSIALDDFTRSMGDQWEIFRIRTHGGANLVAFFRPSFVWGYLKFSPEI